jgi:hypothetical protein
MVICNLYNATVSEILKIWQLNKALICVDVVVLILDCSAPSTNGF